MDLEFCMLTLSATEIDPDCQAFRKRFIVDGAALFNGCAEVAGYNNARLTVVIRQLLNVEDIACSVVSMSASQIASFSLVL